MTNQKKTLANQAVMRLWSLLGPEKKPPLSTQAVAVCDVTQERIERLESRIEQLEDRLTQPRKPDTSGSRFDPE